MKDRLDRLKDTISASGRAGARDNVPAAVVWVMLSTVILAGLAAFAKYIMQQGIEPVQIVFLRNAFCCLFLMPLLAWRGPELARSQNYHLYGMRVGISFVSMIIWFTALKLISMAELQAIAFLAPLFATLFAILLLGEQVTRARWLALAAGFAGTLIILRPGDVTVGLGQGLALLSALAIGLIAPLVKQLTQRDDPDKIVFITHLILTPVSLVPAIFVWTWPPAWLWPHIAAMGACALLGHITLVRAFNSADASLVATFEFARLPFAVVIGYVWFGETTDIWTWVGATVIFLAAASVARKEGARKDRQ